MLYYKIQPQRFLVEEEDFTSMAAILFNATESFEQIVNILLTEGRMWNLVKTVGAVAEKKTFKNYTILFMNIAQGQFKGVEPFEQIVSILSIEGHMWNLVKIV